MVSMHWIKWRGKRLLAVAYLEREKNGSLEKMVTDEWEKDLKGKIRVEKKRGEKKVNCGYWKTSMSRKDGAS